MPHWLTAEFWELMMNRAVEWAITTLPSIIIILLFAFFILKLVKVFLKRSKMVMVAHLQKEKQDDAGEMEKRVDTLVGILTSTIRVVVWAVIIMLLLRKLGIDIAPLIAGAGIAGLAFGFGAQELVRDVIAGFFMLLENQIRAGDVAIVNGTSGLVEKVGLRTIVLRDLSGVVHVFQNGKINSLSNMTKEWSGMVFEIGVAYKEDTDRVVEVMKQVAAELENDPAFSPLINESLEVFGVEEFADSAVVIKARFKTKPIQQWTVGREYRRRLKKAFDAQGIEIPFPHQTIYWGADIAPLSLRTEKNSNPLIP